MQVYNIDINEEQRAFIAKAIRIAYAQKGIAFDKHNTEPEYSDNITLLADLFENLPEEEKEAPKTAHGFCY